jgi:hypothetical protein
MELETLTMVLSRTITWAWAKFLTRQIFQQADSRLNLVPHEEPISRSWHSDLGTDKISSLTGATTLSSPIKPFLRMIRFGQTD